MGYWLWHDILSRVRLELGVLVATLDMAFWASSVFAKVPLSGNFPYDPVYYLVDYCILLCIINN